MKHCPVCGTELADAATTCFHCGTTMEEESAPVVEATPVTEAIPVEPVVQEPEAAPASNEPEQPALVVPPKKLLLNTFQYMMLMLLFSIPVVGLIFLFVWGTGNPKNPSLKRFSAAVLLWRLILAVLLAGGLLYLFIFRGPEVQQVLQMLPVYIRALFGIVLY